MKCPKCQHKNPEDSRFCKDCGTQLPPSAEAQPSFTRTIETPREELTRGALFAGRYEIIEELGKGGMGKVFRAEDTKIRQEVALKLIRPEISSSRNTIERFRNEIKTARMIAQRNVCRMFDLGEEQGTYFITMEYVSGEDMKSFLRRAAPLSPARAIDITKQVCEGLAEAHRLGVVHRDLKPANIMIDKDGNARIMDFGIARVLSDQGVTGTGVMIGTPAYMSPEQAEGKDVDARSDLYSLGAVLYEMTTGQLPFKADTALGLALKHRQEIPKNPQAWNHLLSDNFSHLILKCLEKDRENRYPSAEHILADLKTIEKGLADRDKGAKDKIVSHAQELARAVNKAKGAALAFILAVTTIAGLVLWAPWRQRKVVASPLDQPSVAVLYFKNNTGDTSLDHWKTMLSNLLIADLSQSRYIRVLSEESLFQMLSEWDQLEATTFSSSILKRIADRSRVSRFIQGAFAKAGSVFRINVTLQQADTGEILGAEDVSGTGEESVFSMVDELTRRIKSHFEFSGRIIAEDIDMKVEAITTPSTEAFKYYSEGRKYHQSGDYAKSIAMMMKAVEIDPEFAMAFRSLASSYNNLGEIKKSKSFNQKAFNLRNRLSERERHILEGAFFGGSELTYDKAIEAYLKLLSLYPDDVFGSNNLGNIYLDLEEWDKAIEFHEKTIESQQINSIPNLSPYFNLSLDYMNKGMYEKAETVLRSCLREVSDTGMIRDMLARLYLIQGKYDLALEETEKATTGVPIVYRHQRMRGDISFLRNNLSMAEEQYNRLLGMEGTTAKFYGLKRLASLYLLQGRFREAKSRLEQGIEMMEKLGGRERVGQFQYYLGYIHLKSGDSARAFEKFDKAHRIALDTEDLLAQRDALFGKSIACLEMKSWEKARGLADELQEHIRKGMNKNSLRLYYHLKGLMELGKGNHAKAINYFKKALALLSEQSSTGDVHALYIDPLARAYYEAGDFEKAQQEYERIISLTSGRFEYGDIYARSFYRLGKIHEQKGNRTSASKYYNRFSDLWKNADPGLLEVEDARDKISAMKKRI